MLKTSSKLRASEGLKGNYCLRVDVGGDVLKICSILPHSHRSCCLNSSLCAPEVHIPDLGEQSGLGQGRLQRKETSLNQVELKGLCFKDAEPTLASPLSRTAPPLCPQATHHDCPELLPCTSEWPMRSNDTLWRPSKFNSKCAKRKILLVQLG